jgi:hypothetical protein
VEPRTGDGSLFAITASLSPFFSFAFPSFAVFWPSQGLLAKQGSIRGEPRRRPGISLGEKTKIRKGFPTLNLGLGALEPFGLLGLRRTIMD